ncbi:1,4-alpha-glucan branching protein GlgB [Xanthomonas theicola]|uniref:1,4-alpha-glucan branching enzyme GlgB n=1 Tax=Xanthomonas theicola TaxID=56464 RepID=A0A2S6ZJ65_9XANT|nr:1,4-alpha-glucan branching protein GlgB [Xanthomonas theicola]PPT92219.1 1,4-alpha-glucan branching enzyme [Xanthomonas theicola]QNH25842.1 1,4-alpha-glucan branching protein GlgB [Xanthomonas theicola]
MSEREQAPDAIPVWDAPLEAASGERDRLALQALARGEAVDAFAWLGPHADARGAIRVRALVPGAEAMGLLDESGKLVARMRASADAEGIFEGELKTAMPYRLRIAWPDRVQETADPYAFGPVLDDAWLQGMAEGDGAALRTALGAHHTRIGTVHGVRFAVWAPHARRVALVGDFNDWDGRRHPLRLRQDAGVWELFVPGLRGGEHYQYEILGADGTPLPRKSDPVARHSTRATASVVPGAAAFAWHDAPWLAQRAARAGAAQPMSIYELHTGSWRHDAHGQPLHWDALAAQLIPYVQELGFTHVELLPITEHPFGGSWGYPPLGLYAPTVWHGEADGFARFVDACHQAGIGVILDWVSAHFPDDAHGLQHFDGTALYAHADPREGLHRACNTQVYDHGRAEVVAYLIGSALEWIERFHVDGLRVDAVGSMLYRDYGRNEGQWVPNLQGGPENLEAIAFLRRLNGEIAQRFPGVRVMAEESTAWPGVTAPPEQGGLGFSHKWNMGWAHDTLSYLRRDPLHRQHHHSEMSFGLVYAFSEHFVLPLSHHEVTRGKGSLLAKMPGDTWQRFANLRAYLAFMWAHPGRKLLFMGGEFGQWQDWDHDHALDWAQLQREEHRGVARLVGDLNRQLRTQPALYRSDRTADGFEWSVADDHRNSVFGFVRHDRAGGAPPLLSVSNFTPAVHHGYRLGVPRGGQWREILNSDSAHYGGSNQGNGGALHSVPQPMHGHAQSLALTLPPLSTLWLQAEH